MRTLTCLTLVVLALTGSVVTSAAAQSAQYFPPQTRVVVLPILNETSEKWQELKDQQIKKGAEWFKEEFGGRGFILIPKEEIAAEVAALQIDFADESQRSPANLIKLGRALKAQLVILPVITASGQRLIQGLLTQSKGGKVTMRLWFVDSDRSEALFEAKEQSGRASGQVFIGTEKGSTQQIKAVGNTLRDAFKEFLKPYPKPKKG